MVELDRGCDALIVGLDPVTKGVLDAGPLRAVVKYGAGLDNIDVDAAHSRGVKVASTPIANTTTVAELTIGLILCLARHIVWTTTCSRPDPGPVAPDSSLQGDAWAWSGTEPLAERSQSWRARSGCR
jgi:lactate dehydrogenase-like 2-hydroxyacid dehydrogenase